MPGIIRSYVRIVDRLSQYVGLSAMYLIFLMVAVLIFDAITRNVIRGNTNCCWGGGVYAFRAGRTAWLRGRRHAPHDDAAGLPEPTAGEGGAIEVPRGMGSESAGKNPRPGTAFRQNRQ